GAGVPRPRPGVLPARDPGRAAHLHPVQPAAVTCKGIAGTPDRRPDAVARATVVGPQGVRPFSLQGGRMDRRFVLKALAAIPFAGAGAASSVLAAPPKTMKDIEALQTSWKSFLPASAQIPSPAEPLT